jgi:hypothetical protein
VCGVLGGRLVNRIGRSLVIYGSITTATATATAAGLAATAVLVRSASPSDVGLVLALPLLVAGCGAGFVIAANQTPRRSRASRSWWPCPDSPSAGGAAPSRSWPSGRPNRPGEHVRTPVAPRSQA